MILEVIREVNIKSRVFLNVTLCSLVSGYRSSPEIVFNMMVKTIASSKIWQIPIRLNITQHIK